MKTGRVLRRLLRGLALGLAALLGTICVLATAAGIYLSTARGKERLLRALVAELNQVLPGKIAVRRIQQLGPTSVVLEGVTITAPAGNEVVAAERAHAEIALRPLLEGRVVLPVVSLEQGEVDLRQLTHPRAGLVSAFVSDDESSPSPPAAPSSEPDVVIGSIILRDWRVRLPRSGAWTPSELWLYSLQARLSVGSTIEVEVERLDTEVERDGAALGVVALRGQWSSHADSRVELAGNLCETDLVLGVKSGPMPIEQGDWLDVPLDVQLQAHGSSAARLAALADEPELASTFLGVLDANVHVQGSLRKLVARGELALDAGHLSFDAEARELSEFELMLDTEQLKLQQLISGAPDWQLGGRSKGSLRQLSGQSALGLQLSSQLTLNRVELPAIELGAQLDRDALREIELQLNDRWLALSAAGDVGFDGAMKLRTRARFDLEAVRRALRALGLDDVLKRELAAASGRLNAELALSRGRSGALSAQAQVSSPALEVAGTRLEQLKTALAFSGALPRPTVSLDARWAAASRGSLALTASELHVAGGPDRYALQLRTGSPSFGTLAASGWLEPGSRESRFLVSASGELRGAHWRLDMLPARTDGASELVLPDVRVVLEDQRARLHGRYSARDCDLALEFERVDLQRVLGPLAPELARSGLITGKLAARGAPLRPQIELDLRGDALELRSGTKLDTQLSARLDAARGALELQAGVRDADGASTPRLDLTWRAHDDRGRLQTELSLEDASGPWIQLNGQIGRTREDQRRPDLAGLVSTVSSMLPEAMERESWQLELSVARRPLGRLPLPSRWVGLASFALDAKLSAQHQQGTPPQARLDFQVSDATSSSATPSALHRPSTCVGGTLSTKGSLELRGGRFQAELQAQSNQTSLLELTSSGALDVFGLLRGAAPRVPEIALKAHRLPLSRLPYLCERAQGELTLKGRVHDPLGKGLAELDLQLQRFSLGSDQTVDVNAQLEMQRGEVEWQGTLQSANRASRFTGKLSRQAAAPASKSAAPPIDVALELDQLPLAPFFPLQGPISHISGALSGELRARGSAPSPELSGKLQLHDIAFTVTALAQPLNDIQGELSLENDALVLHRLTARDTDGSLTVDGRLAWHGLRELEAGVNLSAKKFPLRQSGQFIASTSANARVDLNWTPEQQDLGIRLREVDVWLDSSRAPEGLALEPHPDVTVRQARKGAGPGALTLEEENARGEGPNRLVIQIQSEDGFWVRRADFDIKLATNLKIVVERPAPNPDTSGVTVTGEIRFDRGYLELLGKMFEVQPGGTLRFPEGQAPTLDLVASYQDRRSEKTVKVHLRGTATAPKLDFTLDGNPITAGEAFQAIYGSSENSSDQTEETEAEASQILSALTAGVITTSIRRRLGAMAPIVAVDPGGSEGTSQVRAGFELDTLIPDFLRDVVTGVYVEGILSSEKQDQQGTERDVQPGVLIELHFPHNIVTSGRYGPDTTWTIDVGWQP